MSTLLLGLVVFFAVHSISIINESWRDQTAEKLGEWPWKGVYSIISIIGFFLIVNGYAQARAESLILYSPPEWLGHLAMLLLLPVFPLLLATYFPGKIKSAAKHPMLLATKFWALAHLLVNGAVVDLLLFGSFLVWAGFDRASMKRREQRTIPGAPTSKINDVIVVVGGLAIYGAFVVWLHGLVIGVPLT